MSSRRVCRRASRSANIAGGVPIAIGAAVAGTRSPSCRASLARLARWAASTRLAGRARIDFTMSYAIVRVGGKQYRVEKGDSIVVDRMSADEGAKVDLEPLLYADGDKSVLEPGELGRVTVQATVTGHERGKKIHGLKFKPKRGYKRRYGHRQDLTRLEIADIKVGAAKRAAREKQEDEDGS
jgi:large subunit ribosomal protein L21